MLNSNIKMKINSENENNQNEIKVLKSYKIYTAT